MKKQNYYLKILALLSFVVIVGFSFHSITNDDLEATSEGTLPNNSIEGDSVLWDNSAISPTTSGIISSRLRGVSDTNDVTIADNFIVPSGDTWLIDSIAVRGFRSTGTQAPDSMNFVIRTDNAGSPGAIVHSVNFTGLNAPTTIARITGIFGTPLNVPAGKYWLEVVAVFDTNTVLRTARWNWNYGTVGNGGDTANIRSRATYFGAPFNWRNVNNLVAADLSHWFIVYGSVAASNETLVLLHDSTTGSTSNRNRKKADRDTLFKYLPDLVSGYDVMYFDTTTTLPGLSGYKTIIVQETGFDAAISRYLGAAARGQIKAWLNSGTAGNKKALLMISADNGYNYSRSGSRGRDLMLSQTMMKYVYQADNSGSRTPRSITGITIDVGNTRNYSGTPPAGGFYPDGCSAETGGAKLYHYTARGTDDSLAAIGYSATGYVSAILNLDPRYFTGDFKVTLEKMIGYLVSNGGVITGTPTITSNLPDNYSLSQNYPNPFNPSTKINFSIPQAGLVSIVVYDMLGREVQSLVNENLTAGSYIAEFNGAGLSSGTYFYRLQVGEFVQVKRMVLLK